MIRLDWKLTLIKQINQSINSEPSDFDGTNIINFKNIKFNGKVDYEKQIYLYSLNDSGKPGYDVVTPFRTDKNQNVLINRGWIKKELKGSASINSKAESDSAISSSRFLILDILTPASGTISYSVTVGPIVALMLFISIL